jgi:hypothetical protein
MNRPSIELVIESNNHGVHLMGQRQFLAARQAFYNASDTLKAILDEQENAIFQVLQRSGIEGWREYVEQHLWFDEASPAAAGPAFIVGHDAASGAAASRYDFEAVGPGGGRQQHERSNTTVDNENPSHQQPAPPGHHASSSYSPATTSNTTTERRRKSRAAPTAEHSSAKLVNGSDDDLFVFLQPILLSADAISRARSPPITYVSICILINLALSCHSSALDGRQVPLLRETALRDAVHLYQLAYSLQVHTRVEVSRLYTFAMVNNLGHLHMMLHQQQGNQGFLLVKSRECFAILMRMISVDRAARSCLATTGDPPRRGQQHPSTFGSSWSLIEDTYVDLFLDNVFLMGMGYDGACHAAAA